MEVIFFYKNDELQKAQYLTFFKESNKIEAMYYIFLKKLFEELKLSDLLCNAASKNDVQDNFGRSKTIKIKQINSS